RGRRPGSAAPSRTWRAAVAGSWSARRRSRPLRRSGPARSRGAGAIFRPPPRGGPARGPGARPPQHPGYPHQAGRGGAWAAPRAPPRWERGSPWGSPHSTRLRERLGRLEPRGSPWQTACNMGSLAIAPDTLVTLSYTLFDEQGEAVDRATKAEPLTYVHGYAQIVPGLEKGLEGLRAGERRELVVEPADAFGEHDDGGVFEVD